MVKMPYCLWIVLLIRVVIKNKNHPEEKRRAQFIIK